MYRFVFLNRGQVYELYCRQVASSNLYGFVEASGLAFESSESVVIDPVEERMRDEFAETEVLYVPIQSVVRIEKVNRRGTCVIRDRNSGEKVTSLPLDRPGRKR